MRPDETRAAQRYLKRIRYGNRPPYFPALKAYDVWPERWPAPWPQATGIQPPDGSNASMFKAVLDCGGPDANALIATDAGTWPTRIRSRPIVPVSRRTYRTYLP
jgi:hypothetical protein